MDSKNKRIVTNSILLNLRMILVLLVTLYTSRVVLEVLGVVDFGIYNVVAGLVALMTFVGNSLSNSSQRYLNIGLANDNLEETRQYFQQSFTINVIIILIIIAIAETAGLWFVRNRLVLPADRLYAAIWAYQMSLAIVIYTFLQVPFNSAVVAREKFSFFAYIGILDVFLKLVCAFLIKFFADGNNLVRYSVLLMLCSLITLLTYVVYCMRKFPECRPAFIWRHGLVKEMGIFIGHNFFGSFAWSAGNQGTNVLLNLFFGPTVNAARGIAMQVYSAVYRFTDTISTAIKPQIIQSYAHGNIAYMMSLVSKGSVFSFIFMLFLIVPIVFNIDFVLRLWLGTNVAYSSAFTSLLLVDALVNTLPATLLLAAMATGNIKRNQVWGRCFILMVLPISYIALKLFPIPILPFIIGIVLSLFYTAYCIYDIKVQTGMAYGTYFRKVLLPISYVLFPLCAVSWIEVIFIENEIFRFLCISATDIVITGSLTYLFVFDKDERAVVRKFIHSRLLHKG